MLLDINPVLRYLPTTKFSFRSLIKLNGRYYFKMPYVKNSSYRDIPFSKETPIGEFYTYYSVKDLLKRCEQSKGNIIQCRTIGILQSSYGKFVIQDMDLPINSEAPAMLVSMVYLKIKVPSVVIPHPVQIFGTVQWKNVPILFAKILQPMNTPTAIRMRNALHSVSSNHLAQFSLDSSDEHT